MANPNGNQGTKWESDIRKRADRFGIEADRYPKRGQKNEPDVWLTAPNRLSTIPAVAWKRLVGKKKDGRRKPDGEKEVVVITLDDFLYLVAQAGPAVDIQAKAIAALNVTRELGGLRNWLSTHRGPSGLY